MAGRCFYPISKMSKALKVPFSDFRLKSSLVKHENLIMDYRPNTRAGIPFKEVICHCGGWIINPQLKHPKSRKSWIPHPTGFSNNHLVIYRESKATHASSTWWKKSIKKTLIFQILPHFPTEKNRQVATSWISPSCSWWSLTRCPDKSPRISQTEIGHVGCCMMIYSP